MSFWAMGGYGFYVWPAFGATALVLVGLLLASLRTLRANEARLEALQSTSAAARGVRRRAVREPSQEAVREA